MVDFSKKLGKPKSKKPIDPLEIYENLDRASDKGPLRPAQEAILMFTGRRRRCMFMCKNQPLTKIVAWG
jgi:hypothetical protein